MASSSLASSLFSTSLALPFAFLLAGCPNLSTDGPDPENRCVTAPDEFDGTDADRLDVGTTTNGVFTAMHDGESFPIVFGPQGGQHFFYTLRAHTGMTPLVVNATLRDANGAQVGRAFEYAEVCDQTWLEIQNARLFLDSSSALAGTLTVQLGTCPDTGCAYDEATDTYTLEGLLSEKVFQISVVEAP